MSVFAFGCWVGLVVLFAAQNVVVLSASWKDALLQAARFWILWLGFLPVVAWLSFMFPLFRERFATNILIHIVALFVVVAASQVAYRNIIIMQPLSREVPVSSSPDSQPVIRRVTPRSDPGRFAGFHAAFDILIYLGVFAVCRAFANAQRSREREMHASELAASLAQAKLQTLRMQINPHFIFNTLNAISTLVHKDPAAADDMIGDLSDFLRSTLESGNEQEVPLQRELDFAKRYLAIEQRRFGERLKVGACIEPGINKALVPALLLQPLVENAVKHALEPTRKDTLIRIDARRAGDQLHLVVADNGSGPVDTGSQTAGHGIGLKNTRARLQELYGGDHFFSIERGSQGGCVVTIKLPYHEQPVFEKNDRK